MNKNALILYKNNIQLKLKLKADTEQLALILYKNNIQQERIDELIRVYER